MEKITGKESAFPYMGDITHNPQFDSVPGMNLRTYIATQAMSGLIGQFVPGERYSVNNGFIDAQDIAADAIKVADALLNELNK